MSRKIIITGATGLIGQNLSAKLIDRGDEVTIFSRNSSKAKKIIPQAINYVDWNYKNNSWEPHIDGADAVIHLAGENLFRKRWSKEHKSKILNSRMLSTKALADAIAKSKNKPFVFICASAIGYYSDRGEEVLTENSSGSNDFLSEVCKRWEEEASKIEQYGVRRVSIRTGIVLSTKGGALKKMLPAYKFFLGGALGSGEQWFSWIHIDDVVNTYLFALDNVSVNGAVNSTAPNPVKMNTFAKELGIVLKKPSMFNVPKFILKAAAGEAAEVILASQRVNPQKLLSKGFVFSFSELEPALRDLIKKNK